MEKKRGRPKGKLNSKKKSIFEKLKKNRGHYLWTLPAINQKLVIEKFGDKLDYRDLFILGDIISFINSDKVESIVDDFDIKWYFVAETKIIYDLPLLGIETETPIINRITKLVKVGLIERHPENINHGKKYIRVTKKADFIFKFLPSSKDF